MKKVWNNLLVFTAVLRGFTWFVLFPTFLVAIYYTFFASPIFVSETHFTVRSQSDNAIGSASLSGILSGMSSSIATQDVAIVGDYINSKDMLERLDAQLGLKKHYASKTLDWWARLPTDCSTECFLEYYQDKIEILADNSTGIVKLETKAFDAAMAKAMADLILQQSEALVNTLSDQITRDSIAYAEAQHKVTEERFKEAAERLTHYRNITNILDPAEKTGAVMGIITTLESRIAEARAERDQLLSYLRSDNAQVVGLSALIRALEDQVAKENQRLTGQEQVELSEILQEYERLTLEKEMAHQLYTSTLASLESARNEASRKQLYLITFVRPLLADSAVEPEGVWNTFTVFALLLLLYVLAGLMITTIKDHMGF